jgi:predicted nucleic acid-binding protein
VIFIDANVPMYLVGAAHPNKEPARRALEQVAIDGEALVTDAEVLQELVRRFAAIGRRDAIQPAFDALLGVVDIVYPIESDDVHRAHRLVVANSALSARDALHVAVMQRYQVTRIVSFDRAFNRVSSIERLPIPSSPSG